MFIKSLLVHENVFLHYVVTISLLPNILKTLLLTLITFGTIDHPANFVIVTSLILGTIYYIFYWVTMAMTVCHGIYCFTNTNTIEKLFNSQYASLGHQSLDAVIIF